MLDRLITPKRNHRSFEGREGWFPYYAGFSEGFASSTIAGSKLNKNSTILDPWNGSGTTTCAAYQLGYRAIGYDLNPVMVVVARARGMSHGEKPSIRPLLIDILRKSSAQKVVHTTHNDPLTAWFDSATTARIRLIEQAIHTLLVEPDEGLPQEKRNVDGMSDIAAFFYTALFRSVRKSLESISVTNPTWFKRRLAPSQKLNVSKDKVQAIFSNVCSQMVQEMTCTRPGSSESKGSISARVGKSQSMQIDDASVDLILTSPPY